MNILPSFTTIFDTNFGWLAGWLVKNNPDFMEPYILKYVVSTGRQAPEQGRKLHKVKVSMTCALYSNRNKSKCC